MSKQRTEFAVASGFPPISTPNARVLLLGSMPSVASLAKHEYYGHPQNAFWPIMGRLFEAGPELPYDQRKAVLCECGVAVWDVLKKCRRAGSLDSSIRVDSETPNDFSAFFREHPQIRVVYFNGQKAQTAFRRHVMCRLVRLERKFCYVRLPSTSPAYAGRSFAEKLAAWQAVRRAATLTNQLGRFVKHP